MSSPQLVTAHPLPLPSIPESAPRQHVPNPRLSFVEALQALARNQPRDPGDRDLLLIALLPHLDDTARDEAWAVIAFAERSRAAIANRDWPAATVTDRRPRETGDEHYDRALVRAEYAVAAACRQAIVADERAAIWSRL